MELGTFSVSLAVKDMTASRDFYDKGANAIGLFQGMLDSNLLTFNPGWEGLGQPAHAFTDVRELRASLAASGLVPTEDTTAGTPAGPASFKVTDPDGNVILIDQHV